MTEDLTFKASEFVKKLLTVGVGTVFMTEESIRALVSEFKLPKEFLTGVLDSAQKTKDEFLTHLSKEMIGQVMNHVNLSSIAQEILEKNDLKIEMTIQFQPKGRNRPAHN